MLRIIFNKKIFLLLFVFCISFYSGAVAGDIIVLQSARFPVYNDALQGLESIILRDIPTRGQKTILPHTISTRILSEENDQQSLLQDISRQRPDVIAVIGSSSLSLIKEISGIPIVYLMVPNPEPLIKSIANITGVNMNLTAGQQLESLIRALPEVRRIGLLYDPGKTASLAREAEDFAKRHDINIVAQPVKSSREVPGQLARLKDKIDCFWMVPDQTVITPETLDHIFLFSLEYRIPILTFAEKYLKLGATLSVTFDADDIGKQAGEMVISILNNTPIADMPPVQARKVNVMVNHKAAKTLGIDIRE